MKNNLIKAAAAVPELKIADIEYNTEKIMEVIDKHGTDVVINGSVMGTDAYAMKHRLHTKPYQILRIYDGDDVCTYKVML